VSSSEQDEDGTWQVHLKGQSQSRERIHRGLEQWLRRRLHDRHAAVDGLRTPGGTGVANETVLFDLHREDGRTEGYVARLATPDSLYLDFDLEQHFRMYESMSAFPSVPTPAVLGYEDDAEIVGAPFFVMERIEGSVPTDNPSWAVEGFVADASPQQRRRLWERTVRVMCELHRLPAEPFDFLRTGAADTGTGDMLDYWSRYRRWAEHDRPCPLIEECEEWLLANQPHHTELSWGDSRLPNVIYRDYEPVALLDWDLVSLGGAQADVAWWILMEPSESARLDGVGRPDDLVELWEATMTRRASELRWYLVFGAYRLAGIMTKLFGMMTAAGHLAAGAAESLVNTGLHVQLMAGLLELTPPKGVEPVVPRVRLDR
jgi:aminoglycoside phosphotransferase (APT) family kinase protein